MKSKSKYSKMFNSKSKYWENDKEYNLLFLKATQTIFNDILKDRGYVFLRDIYEALDIPITVESIMVGWIYDENKRYEFADGFIKFEITANGNEQNIELDFNVDGLIIDKITEES